MKQLIRKIRSKLKPNNAECETCVFYFDCKEHTGKDLKPCILYYPYKKEGGEGEKNES